MLRAIRRLLPTFFLGSFLALLNITGCVLFVLSRPPLEGNTSGVVSAAGDVDYQVVACRRLDFWERGSTGEPVWLKAFVTANIFPVILVVFFRMLLGYLPGFTGLSLCARSWIIAVAFLVAATVQWYSVGAIVEDRFRRFFNVSA